MDFQVLAVQLSFSFVVRLKTLGELSHEMLMSSPSLLNYLVPCSFTGYVISEQLVY